MASLLGGLSLSSAHAPRACPRHDSGARQCPLTQILTYGLLTLPWSWVFLVTWTSLMASVTGPHPHLAMPTWASDPPHLCGLVWLSQLLAGCHQTCPAHSLWVLLCSLGRALPLPTWLHTLPSVLEVLIPGSWWFFNFHCLPPKGLELMLWC